MSVFSQTPVTPYELHPPLKVSQTLVTPYKLHPSLDRNSVAGVGFPTGAPLYNTQYNLQQRSLATTSGGGGSTDGLGSIILDPEVQPRMLTETASTVISWELSSSGNPQYCFCILTGWPRESRRAQGSEACEIPHPGGHRSGPETKQVNLGPRLED